jgi:uncharacterized protein YidB (DUF937 family)
MMRRLIEKFQDAEHLHRTEGRQGVILLACLARALGYKDPQYFGQLDSRCAIGDLINFLEDNSGAVEAVLDWVGKQRNSEWKAALAEYDDEDEG